MKINSIEVIKSNPGTTIQAVPGERVELNIGDTLRIHVSFDYRGVAQKATLYGAIGKRKYAWPFPDIRWFDEMIHGSVTIDLPKSPADFTPCVAGVDIQITSLISLGINYDLYVKISEYLEAGLPEVDGVIDIVSIPPEDEIPPDEEREIPWGTIALGVGGLALAVALVKPKATERKK